MRQMLPISFVVDIEGFVFDQTVSNTKPGVQIHLSLGRKCRSANMDRLRHPHIKNMNKTLPGKIKLYSDYIKYGFKKDNCVCAVNYCLKNLYFLF